MSQLLQARMQPAPAFGGPVLRPGLVVPDLRRAAPQAAATVLTAATAATATAQCAVPPGPGPAPHFAPCSTICSGGANAAGGLTVAPVRARTQQPIQAQTSSASGTGPDGGAATPSRGGSMLSGGGACLTPGINALGSTSPAEGGASAPGEMVPGQFISIGRHQFLVGDRLGEGAYAQVWTARSISSSSSSGIRSAASEEVAIKEMRVGQGPGILPDASLHRALFEIQVMQCLIDTGACHGTQIAAPRIIDHQVWPVGATAPGAYLCRVAMTRRPGQPLVNWLEDRMGMVARRRSGRQHATVLAPLGLGSAAEDVSAYCASFCDAARVVRAMLGQLSPTMEHLNSSIAYHRDVNARNLLVHCPPEAEMQEGGSLPSSAGAAPRDASKLTFTVLDFGSSADAAAWLGAADGSWQIENPTGDARYWGAANWVRFLEGADVLSQDPDLQRQYSQRLDIFALAVCTLEALAKLHCAEFPPEATFRVLPLEYAFESQLAHGVHSFSRSWAGYWAFAVHSFDRLAEYSQLVCRGDQLGAYQTWQELSVGQIPRSLSERLREVRADLAAVAEICRTQPVPRNAELGVCAHVGATLECLCDMVSEQGVLGWSDLAARCAPVAAPIAGTLASPQPRRLGSKTMHTNGAHRPSGSVNAVAHGNVDQVSTDFVTESEAYARMVPITATSPRVLRTKQNQVPAPADLQPLSRSAGSASLPQLGVATLGAQRDGSCLNSERPVSSVKVPSVGGSAGGSTRGDAAFETGDQATRQSKDAYPAAGRTHGLSSRSKSPRNGLAAKRGAAAGGTERELEALRILRQVETEVRTLKKWYTEAIEAMRAPVPGGGGGILAQPGNGVGRSGFTRARAVNGTNANLVPSTGDVGDVIGFY